jgi:hypothetical protein
MDRLEPKHHEKNNPNFTDKFKELLADVEFEESAEMYEARRAVVEALTEHAQDPDLIRLVWIEYAKVCEQAVDSKTSSDANPQTRARLQIAVLVHKALIFREIGNMQRYGEDLADVEEYALTKHLGEISDVISKELSKTLS